MTRARDLADSADKDIAGTLTLDGLTVGTDNTGFGVSHSTASSTATNLTFYTTNGSATAILEFTHSGHGLSAGDLVNVGSSSVTSWLTTWGIFDLTSIADEVEVIDTTSTTFRVNITCTSVQTSSVSLGQGGSYVYYKGTTTVSSGTTTFNGDVGVGTTNPARKFHVQSDSVQDIAVFEGSNNGIVIQGSSSDANMVELVGYKQSDATYADVHIRADVDALYIKEGTGNVGIGTSSPSTALEVVGKASENVRLTSYQNTGANYLSFYHNSGNRQGYIGYGSAGSNVFYVVQEKSDNIEFYTGGSTKMVLDTSGNVGIGTTSPSSILHVNGGSGGWGIFERNSKQLYVNANYSGQNNYAQVATRGSDSMGLSLSSNDGNPEYMFINTSGNVGIGTTNPTTRFHVQSGGAGNSNGTFYLGVDTATNYPAMVIQTATGGNYTETHGLYIKNTAAGYGLRIDDTSGDTSPFVVDSSGNVGIGHTDPSYAKLHVRNDVSGGNDNFLLMLQNATTVADSRAGIMFSTNSGQGAGRDGAAIQATNNGIDGKAHLTFGNVINNAYQERVRFSTDGHVTMPYQPCFIATRNSDQSFNSTESQALLDSVDLNVGSVYSTSTKRFTAPVAGKYQFSFQATLNSISSGAYNAIYVKLNGSGTGYRFRTMTGSGWTGVNSAWVMNLSANDYLELWGYTASGSMTTQGNEVHWCGYLIG